MSKLITIFLLFLSSFILAQNTEGGCPLCIDVKSFTLQSNNGIVCFQIETLNESNIANFEILSSVDVQSWKEVTSVKVEGKVKYQYSYIPNTEGVIYYRLKQVDNDGSNKIIKTISAVIKSVPKVLNGIVYSKGSIEVFDILGQLLGSGFDTYNLCKIQSQMIFVRTERGTLKHYKN